MLFLLFIIFMGKVLLQWNCRGLFSNTDDIHSIIEHFKPISLCLQETHLNTQPVNSFKQYNVVRKDRLCTGKPSGGVAILSHKTLPYTKIALQTNLEAVAIRISLDRLLTVCSLYISPSCTVTQTDIHNLIAQLPVPFILQGDLNAHNPLWGSSKRDARGKLLEDTLLQSTCLLNKKQYTYVNAANASFSCLDLTFCSPLIFQCLQWGVNQNPYGSDHFPTYVKYLVPINTLTVREPRWKLEKADWTKYTNNAILTPFALKDNSIEEANDVITSIINRAASAAIPRTTASLPRRCKPWWNDDCRQARKFQQKAWAVFRKYPTTQHLIEFKRKRAQARRTYKEAKRESWRNYVGSLNASTPSKVIWDRLNKIRGNYHAFSFPLIQVNGKTCRTLDEQADILGEHFQHVSSSEHYSTSFLKIKKDAEKKRINVTRNNSETYNLPFTSYELERALDISHKTSPGPDGVHYDMLSHLRPSSKDTLLSFFNRIWVEGTLPSAWKLATVIPILKPGKEPTSVTSYRPIALTSCIGKTFERMVNARLMYFLTKNGFLDKKQCGFRQGYSTVDHIVRFESNIREAFLKRQFCLSVFFDLEKAYDTTWRYGILRDLHAYGLQGRMLSLIENFLQDRFFKVRLGATYSKLFEQENGVPQGSVLSVTLFIVKMNSIATAIPRNISYSLYVDDVHISYSSLSLSTAERQLQIATYKLAAWARENGFTFSPQKTACVVFSRRRGIHPDPCIMLNGHQLAVKDEQKFLGVVFDRKLTFTSHVRSIRKKGLKALNILKILSHKSWGADKVTMLTVYRSVVRSILDYGCVAYGSARESTLKMLDTVHHAGIRLSLGAFRTSPIESLYVESGEPSLDARRKYLTILHVLRMQAYPENPSYHCLQTSSYSTLFSKKLSIVPPLSIRSKSVLEEYDLGKYRKQVMDAGSDPAPWEWRAPVCDTTLKRREKKNTSPHVLQQEFEALREGFGCHEALFTDGTKSSRGVGCAVISDSRLIKMRLPDAASIFTAELYAIKFALEHINHKSVRSSVIYTDSLSSLQAISALTTKNPLVKQIRCLITTLRKRNLVVKLAWVPSHVGIKGNELADQAAAESLLNDICKKKIPHQDLKPLVKKMFKSKWQFFWDTQTQNKLHLVQPHIEQTQVPSHNNRFHGVIQARLRLGHTYLTHGFLLRGEDPPECVACGCQMTVVHLLLECPEFQQQRQLCFKYIYRRKIPLHLSLLIGDHAIVDFKYVIKFLSLIGVLSNI